VPYAKEVKLYDRKNVFDLQTLTDSKAKCIDDEEKIKKNIEAFLKELEKDPHYDKIN